MNKTKAQEYENKAMMLLQKAAGGGMDQAEADKLAQSALEKKDEVTRNLTSALQNQKKYDESVSKLDTQIKKLKSNITTWENEARVLKARAKVSEATKTVNKQLAGIDSSSTVAMLERMKEKVDQQEALSESYAEIANDNVSVDDEINLALENTSSSDALNALKQKLALKGGDVNEVYVDSYGDGYITNSIGLEPLTKTADIDLSTARYDLTKERIPTKCRNFALRMVVREANELYLQSIGYIFKLGKVREH